MNAPAFYHLRASRRQWWLVIATGALTLLCGSIGVWQYEHAHSAREIQPLSGVLSSLYHALQMLVLHTPYFEEGSNLWIELGRWLGAFTLIATTGMLLWKRLAHEFRLFRMAGWQGHYVVCGLGQKGHAIVRSIRQREPQALIAVVDPLEDNPLAGECCALGACYACGDARDAVARARARMAQAREVIIITPDDETNVGIALGISAFCAERGLKGPLCQIQLSDIHLREICQKIVGPDAQPGATLHFFDVYDDEARRVLCELPLDGHGIKAGEPDKVHVVILGLGRMGRSVALRAARMGHFANRQRLRISVIDRHAERQRESLLFHYPALKSGEICQLDFHQAEAESATARSLIEQWAAEQDTRLHVFLCLDENSRAAQVALRLQQALSGRENLNLLVRIKSRTSLQAILEMVADRRPRLAAFGRVEDACTEQAFRHEHNEALARAMHEQFVANREADSVRKPASEATLLEWDNLPEDVRESNRQQADHIDIKLRAIGCESAPLNNLRPEVTTFTEPEIELLAELEHQRWISERRLAGWRYGTPSNKAKRVSEYLVPWNELDGSIQKYDRQSVMSIPALLKLARPPMKAVRKTKA
jgi:voltage-gated potassium channel Kch